MLSLGAPFWYKVLGELLKLRPAMASKDDQQREQRRASQAADGESPRAVARSQGQRVEVPRG